MPNYFSKGWSHIENVVQIPSGRPLLITPTGYLSHLLDRHLLAKGGRPVAFFSDWVEREAKSTAWAKK